MKTAIQELEDKLKDNLKWIVMNADYELMDKLFSQALEKEKEQIIDFSIGAYQNISRMKGVPENLISENKIIFEEYYNKTYNK
jgi:hypothetical protein